MSTISEQNNFTADVARLICFIHEHYFVISFGECWRPQEMQQIYFDQGKSKTLKNTHGDRLAIDLNFFEMVNSSPTLTYDKKKLQFIGDYWESLDKKNRWGGNWKSLVDTPHFERKIT
jgi:hypothetical protein